ncbi:hypothetical protein AB0B40_24275 [Streptomyces sp. NPDC042638]|uniref:hypothetical protein n=1 Tax=Streptomyces sp. NPDC042638 TaxID=3154333 RepID=UPI0033FB0B6E
MPRQSVAANATVARPSSTRSRSAVHASVVPVDSNGSALAARTSTVSVTPLRPRLDLLT